MSSVDRLQTNPGAPLMIERAGVVFLENVPRWVQDLKIGQWRPEQVVLADPLSYCAGVIRANIAVEQLLDENTDNRDEAGVSVYLYHAPIHNDTKLAEWESRGARIVNSLDEVPVGSVAPVLLSAHGVSPSVWFEAKRKGLKGRDATCPLVDKTHREVKDLAKKGYKTLLVGHSKHDEIVGTLGEAPENIIVIDPKINRDELIRIVKENINVPLALRTQTTLAVEDTLELIETVLAVYPDLNLASHTDICFATQNRQEAIIKTITDAGVDCMIIFGSNESKRQPSSNSIRLREVAVEQNVPAFLVEDITEIDASWLTPFKKIGLSAGASADPKRVAEMLVCLGEAGVGYNQITRLTVKEEPQVFAAARSFDFSKGV